MVGGLRGVALSLRDRRAEPAHRKPRSARIRAQTKPSPPLLPGPRRADRRRAARAPRATASATARPARSISQGPDARRDREPVGLGHFGRGQQFNHERRGQYRRRPGRTRHRLDHRARRLPNRCAGGCLVVLGCCHKLQLSPEKTSKYRHILARFAPWHGPCYRTTRAAGQNFWAAREVANR